jgi:hypothetical protein
MISSDFVTTARAHFNLTSAATNKFGLEPDLIHERTQCAPNTSLCHCHLNQRSRIPRRRYRVFQEWRGTPKSVPAPVVYWTVIVTGAVWLRVPDLPVTMSVTCCGEAI